MNNEGKPEGLQIQEGKLAVKKEYVKPTIDEGVEMPTAIAFAFTPVAEN